jgi:hypothetical protein
LRAGALASQPIGNNGATRRVDDVGGIGEGAGRPPKGSSKGWEEKKSSAIGHDVQQLILL